MAQPDETQRQRESPERQKATAPPIATPSSDPATREPKAPPPSVPVDLALVRGRGLASVERDRYGVQALTEDQVRDVYPTQDTTTLRTRGERLVTRLAESDVGPQLARELARSLLQIRRLLLERGAELPARFDDHPRWRAIVDAGSTDAATPATPRPAARATDINARATDPTTPAKAPATVEPTKAGSLAARPAVAAALDEQRATLHATTRGSLAVLDPADLLARARSIDAALEAGTYGPLEARARAETLAYIRDLLRERSGAGIDDPAFRRAIEPAAAATVATTTATPPRPRRIRPVRPRLRQPPTRALPEGAILLDAGGPVPPATLLRHATNLLLARGLPSTGKKIQYAGRTIELPDIVTEPAASAILTRFSEAVDGRADEGRRRLTATQRVEALRDARDRLHDYVGPTRIEDSAAIDALVTFENAFTVQSDGLAGLVAAERVQRGLTVDPALAGLAAPTLEDVALTRNIDVLLLALDDASKGVTAATRLQTAELSMLSAKAATDLSSAGFLSPEFPVGRLGFIGSMVFLRALLNATKALIYGGDILKGGNAFEKANAGARLLEGLFGGMYFLTIASGLIAGQPIVSASALAQYYPIGRNLVWTSAITQLLSGAIHLTSVALGHEQFRRSFVTDILYGGAGSLPPGAYVANKILDRAIARAERRQIGALVGQLAPAASEAAVGAAELAEATAVRDIAGLVARKSIASRVGALAGPLTYYIALVDVPLQVGAFALTDADRVSTRTNITTGLLELQYFAGGVSGRAVDLVEVVRSPQLSGVLAKSRAGALLDTMVDGLANLHRRHASTEPGAVPALARRIEATEGLLRSVQRDDPASVVKAARDVLASVRAIFGQAQPMFVEELRRLDEEAVVLRLHTDITTPKP